MTRTTWFAMEWLWKIMTVVALALGWSAQAEPWIEPEQLAQGSLAERQERAARRVLMTSLSYSMALGDGGGIWLWGSGHGQHLGTWPEIALGRGTPVRMPRMTGAVSLSTNAHSGHSLALLEDGAIEAWGGNAVGQLGNGSTGYQPSRVRVLGVTDAVSVSAGGAHSLAIRRDGTVWAWGGNFRGQLGNGTTAGRALPGAVPGLSGMVAVAAGSAHSLALREDGTVWAWGDNARGQLGDGTRQHRLTPVQVVGLTDVVFIETRSETSYAVRADGTVWAWGNSYAWDFGPPPSLDFSRSTPTQVAELTRVVAVAAGAAHGLALRQDGSVWAWGSNFYGQLGGGTLSQREPPHPVAGLHGMVAVAAGAEHSLVLRRDGSVLAWGRNAQGALGTGSERRMSPAPVVGLTDVLTLAETSSQVLAVRRDGTVWRWGSGNSGNEIQATPTPLEGLSQAVAVAASPTHSLVLRQDGTVWAWGDNLRGQLGDGTLWGERRDTPAPVQGLEGVVAVAAGAEHSLALKQDGTVWAWGANHFSQLGDMTLDDQPLPVQVEGLSGVAAIYASGDLSVAVLRDGSVLQWGSHWDVWWFGDMMPRRPEQVPELTGVVKVTMLPMGLAALRADGTVWQWSLPYPWEQSTVLPVEGLTDAVDMAWGTSTTQILRADGTVWNTGGNIWGERGFPTDEEYSPELLQVPGLTGVVALFADSSTVHALRADGTLVGWGNNMYGTIGDGVSPLHLTPVRVPLPCRLVGQTSGEELQEPRCHAAP